MRTSLAVLLLLAAACAPNAAPIVEAHRFGAGEFPQNSLSALKNTVAKGWPAIEFDLVLTKDLVPVVSHDPWVHQTLCTRADGTALPQPKEERIFVKDLTLDELQSGFVCGGVPDESQPGAKVVAEPMISLAQVVEELRAAPSMLVHLDVKYEPGMTADADTFAREILAVWRGAALPNPWYVSANLPECLRAFKALANGGEVPTSLIWPRFPPDSESQQVAIALKSEAMTGMLGFQSLVSLAKDAQADGLAIAYQVADREAIQTARAAGLKVQLWTLNSDPLLSTYCDWPIDGLITDLPGSAPCL